MSVGWEFDQTMSENQDSYPDVYHLKLDIVLKTSFYFSPVFNFPRLIYLEPIFEVQEFDFGYHIDMAKFWIYPSRKDLLCFSAYLGLDPVTVLSTLIMRFQECYKTLWNCVYNLKNWTGEDSLIFESCSQSSKTTVTTFEKEYPERTFGVLGSQDDDTLRTGSLCTPGTGFWPLFPIDYVQQMVWDRMANYMAEKQGFGVKKEVSLFDVEKMRDTTEETE